jgi:exopolyphosphatase
MSIEALQRFLTTARQSTSRGSPLHLVLGNESADPDSIVSALMYAFLRWTTATPQDPLPVPVINCPPGAIRQRPEASYLLAEAGISPACLVYYPELELGGALPLQRIQLTLVDHNELAPDQRHLKSRVRGIIDHHLDSGDFQDCVPRIIAPVACSATLVAELILNERPGLLDPLLARLLLGPILLDSVNLDPQADRCGTKDRRMAARLTELAGIDPARFYLALAATRLDISGLEPPALLNRDLKTGNSRGLRFAVSAVPIQLDQWLADTPDLPAEIRSFAQGRDLDFFLVLTYFPNPRFERRAMAWALNPSHLKALFAYFNAHGAGLTAVGTPPSSSEKNPGIVIWHQHNVQMSRKHLMPLIDSITFRP